MVALSELDEYCPASVDKPRLAQRLVRAIAQDSSDSPHQEPAAARYALEPVHDVWSEGSISKKDTHTLERSRRTLSRRPRFLRAQRCVENFLKREGAPKVDTSRSWRLSTANHHQVALVVARRRRRSP